MQNTPEREIDLMRLLFALWHRLWVIVLCTVVAGAVALGITFYFVTPMYRANVTIYVDNKSSTEENENYISSTSLSTAQRLVKTYVTIIESDTVLEKVAEVAKLNLPASAIRSMMSASPVNDTEVFRVYISHEDPQMAARVANAIADVAPEQISSFLSGSSTKVIDYAKVPTSPYSPNYQQNIMLGAIVGAVLAIAVICITAIMDVRIEDEEELERLFEHPVLGSIPAFDITPKNGKYYNYQSGYGYSAGSKEAEKS